MPKAFLIKSNRTDDAYVSSCTKERRHACDDKAGKSPLTPPDSPSIGELPKHKVAAPCPVYSSPPLSLLSPYACFQGSFSQTPLSPFFPMVSLQPYGQVNGLGYNSLAYLPCSSYPELQIFPPPHTLHVTDYPTPPLAHCQPELNRQDDLRRREAEIIDTVTMETEKQRPRFNFARLAESATKDVTDVTSPKRSGNDEAQVFSHAMAHVVSGMRTPSGPPGFLGYRKQSQTVPTVKKPRGRGSGSTKILSVRPLLYRKCVVDQGRVIKALICQSQGNTKFWINSGKKTLLFIRASTVIRAFHRYYVLPFTSCQTVADALNLHSIM